MRGIWFALTALSLGACANGTVIYHSDYGSYSRSLAVHAGESGTMATVIVGNPTGAPAPILADRVVSGLDGTYIVRDVKFVAAPPTQPGYRTVIVFGRAKQQTICANPAASASAASAPGPMAGAFCLGDEVLSFTSGRVPPLNGADDPALIAQMQSIGYELFPPVNPNYKSECEFDAGECDP